LPSKNERLPNNIDSYDDLAILWAPKGGAAMNGKNGSDSDNHIVAQFLRKTSIFLTVDIE